MTLPCSCDPRLPAMDRCSRGWVRCNEGLRELLVERGETGNHDANRCVRDGE